MKKIKNYIGFAIAAASILSVLMTGEVLAAETITMGTYYPAPYGEYQDVQVENADTSATLTEFTQGLTKAGINIINRDVITTNYTSGVFWSTLVNNPTEPKAGIWTYQSAQESRLYFGTSNAFSSGITRTMVLDKTGRLGLGLTAPTLPTTNTILDVNGVGAHGAGSPAAPSFAIRSDLGTGMWSQGPNTLNFSTAGIEKVEVTSLGNVAIGSSGSGAAYNPGSAPLNGDNGNLDVNDVWLRNGSQWAGSVGIAGVGPPGGAPNASGSYNGDGAAGNNRLIPTPFPPSHVIVWARNGAGIELSETWSGLVINDTTISAADRPNSSFHFAASSNVTVTYLRLVDGENGFRVGGTTIAQTNRNGTVYYWHAWD